MIDLCDKKLIERALSTPVELVEVLYWKLEDFLFDGKTAHAKWMHEDFLYLAKYNPGAMRHLPSERMERLKEISFELYGDFVPKKRMPVEIKPAIQNKIPFEEEEDLEDFLCDNWGIVQNALGRVEFFGRQVLSGDEYKCDIVATSSEMFYPVELKVRTADHRVVSQCAKYCFYFYRQLRYDRFKKIQGVVCCPGFDEWSLNELRREGVWCYLILPDERNRIRLERIQ